MRNLSPTKQKILLLLSAGLGLYFSSYAPQRQWRMLKSASIEWEKLKELGFYELQKSVWICPYNCKNQIDFIIELFGLREYVRFAVVDSIDNELHLKKIFNLL